MQKIRLMCPSFAELRWIAVQVVTYVQTPTELISYTGVGGLMDRTVQ